MQLLRVPVACAVVVSAWGCAPQDHAGTGWVVDTASVFGSARHRVDSLRVDVYADATVSMAGYAASPTSEYVNFLENLEASIQGTWKRADVHFFRFGERSQELRRDAFLSAKRPAFYSEKITGIDRVIDCESAGRVAVIITDLFQSEGDVNAIVARVKDRCFQRGISVAILGLKSTFNGTVFDAHVPAYRYKSSADPGSLRPFYALMFGNGADLESLISAIAEQTRGAESYVVIAPHVVQRYSVAMKKAPNTRELNLSGRGDAYRSAFTMRNGEASGTMLADVIVGTVPGGGRIQAEQLELVAFRRTTGSGTKSRSDSSVTADITLKSAKQVGDTLRLVLGLALSESPGTYSYKLMLRTGRLGGVINPPWVEQYSSINPTPAADANKTLNLSKFVSDLRRASSSIVQPVVATWYLTIRKL